MPPATSIKALALAAYVLASGSDAWAARPPSDVLAVLAMAATDPSTGHRDNATYAEWKPEELAFGGRVSDRTEKSTAVQGQNVGCALPSEPWGVPAALDAAITGPADKDRACMKALLIPDARITLVTVGADGAISYKLLTLDDWIARTKARGHVKLEEKQLNFRIDHFGDIAHLWSFYALRSDDRAVASGINSIQAIKGTGGWRVASIMVEAAPPNSPLPSEYLP